MAALLSRSLRTPIARSLISPRTRFVVPNPNLSSSSRITISSSRMKGCVSRFLRRELSTQQPFHTVIASPCLVSKLPFDVTASYEGPSSFIIAIKNALQFVSRWLARSRKGPGEQVSSGAGGSAAEPSTRDDVRETIRQCLLMYALVRIYGPNGLMFQLIDECQKEGKEVKEARDLPE